MTYIYSKIYNASQGVWARDVAGNNDPHKVWADNEWNENDAIVGFYSDEINAYHNVIFCPDGFVVYIQTQEDKDRAVFQYGDDSYRIPPVILVNLNDAYEGKFMHYKTYPNDYEKPSNMMDEDEDEDEDNAMDEDSYVSDESDESDDESDDEENRIKAELEDNQDVIDFLYKCYDATNNPFKKAAYIKAIEEIRWYFEPIRSLTEWKPYSIGSHIERKINEFLDGISEDDIINS